MTAAADPKAPREKYRRPDAFIRRGGPKRGKQPHQRDLEKFEPFTLDHFNAWAGGLMLDTWEPWRLEPFQEAFISDVLSGIPECWLVVPEGNGKTTTIAGLALYHCQFTAQAWCPVAASSREQAAIIYLQAEGFVYRSDAIRTLFRPQEGMRRVRCDSMGSRIQVLAADDRTGDGVIPTLCLVDELHRHRDLRLYRTWRGKLEKRGGQIVAISTAGEPGGEFEETRERIRQEATEVERERTFVRAASDHLVLHEWAVPEDGDVEDLKLVKEANPFSGITEDALKRKRLSPTMTLEHWRRFVCNLPTRGGRAAITEAEWYSAVVDEQIPAGEPVWVGLDVAWKWDTTAAVPLWMRDFEYRLFGSATILEPPRDGSSLDPYEVEVALADIHERNPIHTVVMDTSRAEQLAAWAAEEFGCTVIDRPQSNAFAVADFDSFVEALRSGWLHHAGDKGLTRHALNAVARLLPYGDARFDRPSDTRRSSDELLNRRVIDALTAAAMVHQVAAAEFGKPDPLQVPLVAFS